MIVDEIVGFHRFLAFFRYKVIYALIAFGSICVGEVKLARRYVARVAGHHALGEPIATVRLGQVGSQRKLGLGVKVDIVNLNTIRFVEAEYVVGIVSGQ